MQDAGANNDIELLTKLADLEQIASEQLEIAQTVPLLKESLVIHVLSG